MITLSNTSTLVSVDTSIYCQLLSATPLSCTSTYLTNTLGTGSQPVFSHYTLTSTSTHFSAYTSTDSQLIWATWGLTLGTDNQLCLVVELQLPPRLPFSFQNLHFNSLQQQHFNWQSAHLRNPSKSDDNSSQHLQFGTGTSITQLLTLQHLLAITFHPALQLLSDCQVISGHFPVYLAAQFISLSHLITV